jgi:Lon protease-like protein
MEEVQPIQKIEESKAAEIRAGIDDTDLFKEEDEPSEYAEDKMEPLDDNLVCPICLDIFYSPICTMCGHTFCNACLTKDFRKCPLCNEPCFINDIKVNVTIKALLEKSFPKRMEKRKYYHDKHMKDLEEEQKEKDNFTDIPVFFIMGHVTPGSFDFFQIFEPRYQDMVNYVMQRDRRFVIIRKRAEKLGYLVRIEEYRRVMDNRTIIKIRSLERFTVEDYFIPETRQGIAPEGQEQLWFASGSVIRDSYPEFEDAKDREAYLSDLKMKANRVQKLVFENIELRQAKISRKNIGWIQIRYKFPSVVSSKTIEEYISKIGLTALNFFYYGGESNEEK